MSYRVQISGLVAKYDIKPGLLNEFFFNTWGTNLRPYALKEIVADKRIVLAGHWVGGRETPAFRLGSECHTLFIAHGFTIFLLNK
jgi:hypothetical protein